MFVVLVVFCLRPDTTVTEYFEISNVERCHPMTSSTSIVLLWARGRYSYKTSKPNLISLTLPISLTLDVLI